MHDIFKNNLFLIKEHVGVFKAANNFDIFNPETGKKVLECREPSLGFFTKLLRFTDYKRMTPFEIVLLTPEGKPLLIVKRGISIIHSKVGVYTPDYKLIGILNQKLLSIGGRFEFLSPSEKVLGVLQGNLISWKFKISKNDKEIAQITKKWAGLGKELFTSADNYMLEINKNLEADDVMRPLIFAAAMSVDMCFKE